MTIQSFKAEFHLAGGLNLPKIIDCLGSDGKERRQLVKVRLPSSGVVLTGLVRKVTAQLPAWVFIFLLKNYK